MQPPHATRNPIGVGSSLPSSLRNNRRTKVSSAGSRWRDDETPLVARYLAWGGRTCIRVLPAASFSYWCLACGERTRSLPDDALSYLARSNLKSTGL